MRGAAAAELDRVGFARADGIGQQPVQIAPVQHDVRRAVALARGRAEIEPVPGLAGAPVPDHAAGRQHLDALERVFEAERVQHAGAVGADLDAGADLLELGRLLVDLDVEPALEQRQRGGQPADAAADDDDLCPPASLAAALNQPTPTPLGLRLYTIDSLPPE